MPGVATFSPMAILAVVLVLAYVALVAAVIDRQRRRATRHDQVVDLREPQRSASLDQARASRYEPRHLKKG
jgi:hypothetical protein